MAWHSSPLVAVAKIPIRRSFRNHGTACNADKIHTAAEEYSGDYLLARFLDLLKRFPGPAAAPSPRFGARPRGSLPFYYNSLMMAFSRAGMADEVLRLYREMKDSDCQPSLACYGTVINSLVTRHRPEEAEAVFEDMISSGMAPDLASYTILVKLYACYMKQFDLAYEVIRWMVRCGYDPDVVTYSTLITGLCRAGRIEEAWGVLDQMMEGNCTPNTHTYTPILQFYCSEGRITVAQRLLESMVSIGCPPDTMAYNVLINGLCKVRKFDEVEIFLRESALKGWKPDAVTYNTYMNGLCKAGKADEAFKQLEVMTGKGLYPTTVTLNILLDCLCRDHKVWEVKCILERSSELGLGVDVVSHNTVMTRLCEIGKGTVVLKLFTDMFKKKGVSPDTQTFNIVINGLCKAGKLHEAKCIFDNKGFVADIVTYNILIHALYVAGKLGEVQLLLCEMHVKKIAPDTVTLNIIIDRLCRDGRFLDAIDLVRSVEDGFSHELVAHLAHWLVMGGNLTELLRLLDEVLELGLVPDGQIFQFLIRAFCRKGSCQSTEIYKVCLFLDKMLGIG